MSKQTYIEMCPGQWWKVEKCTAKHVLYYSVVHAKGLELLLLYFLLGLDPLVTCGYYDIRPSNLNFAKLQSFGFAYLEIPC
ncbi:hypothetical protein QQP08_009541 [Theobroma cacao]|nr:hypothetical protein QQP08_009541 [Theobroma cacao]